MVKKKIPSEPLYDSMADNTDVPIAVIEIEAKICSIRLFFFKEIDHRFFFFFLSILVKTPTLIVSFE